MVLLRFQNPLVFLLCVGYNADRTRRESELQRVRPAEIIDKEESI